MVVPSDLFGELAEEAILVPRLQPQNPTKHTEKIPSEADQKGKSVNNQDVISITNETYLSASGMTMRLVLSYGGGTPSYVLSLASAASPLLVLCGIILEKT